MAHPGGRPTKYKKKYIKMVDEYLKTCGKQNEKLPKKSEYARYIGVNDNTLDNWCNEKDEEGNPVHPEFLCAIKRIEEAQKEQLMDDGMYGGKEVNSTMAIFLLKCNHGMIETDKHIHEGELNTPLVIIDQREKKQDT